MARTVLFNAQHEPGHARFGIAALRSSKPTDAGRAFFFLGTRHRAPLHFCVELRRSTVRAGVKSQPNTQDSAVQGTGTLSDGWVATGLQWRGYVHAHVSFRSLYSFLFGAKAISPLSFFWHCRAPFRVTDNLINFLTYHSGGSFRFLMGGAQVNQAESPRTLGIFDPHARRQRPGVIVLTKSWARWINQFAPNANVQVLSNPVKIPDRPPWRILNEHRARVAVECYFLGGSMTSRVASTC